MKKIILVIGATGKQGSAIVNALVDTDFKIRVLIREQSYSNELFSAYNNQGIEVYKGDFEDSTSLQSALSDVYGVFTVFQNDFNQTDSERRHAHSLFSAAKEAGVTQIVHTSVSQTGNHNSFRHLLKDDNQLKYWTDKDDIEKELRSLNFPIWTIFRPASLMENYKPPMLQQLNPFLKDNRLVTVYDREKRNQIVTVEDIAKFVKAAFNNPNKFNHKELSLASDELTIEQIADTLNGILNKNIKVEYLSYEEALSIGMHKMLIQAQLWGNKIGYDANLEALNAYQIPLTSFKQWITNNKTEILAAL